MMIELLAIGMIYTHRCFITMSVEFFPSCFPSISLLDETTLANVDLRDVFECDDIPMVTLPDGRRAIIYDALTNTVTFHFAVSPRVNEGGMPQEINGATFDEDKKLLLHYHKEASRREQRQPRLFGIDENARLLPQAILNYEQRHCPTTPLDINTILNYLYYCAEAFEHGITDFSHISGMVDFDTRQLMWLLEECTRLLQLLRKDSERVYAMEDTCVEVQEKLRIADDLLLKSEVAVNHQRLRAESALLYVECLRNERNVESQVVTTLRNELSVAKKKLCQYERAETLQEKLAPSIARIAAVSCFDTEHVADGVMRLVNTLCPGTPIPEIVAMVEKVADREEDASNEKLYDPFANAFQKHNKNNSEVTKQ